MTEIEEYPSLLKEARDRVINVCGEWARIQELQSEVPLQQLVAVAKHLTKPAATDPLQLLEQPSRKNIGAFEKFNQGIQPVADDLLSTSPLTAFITRFIPNERNGFT